MVTTGPPIATSIAPGSRLSVQKQAIESWLALGFRVVSLNCPEEVELLEDQFPGVEFIPQMRTGQMITGKPVIYINDILQYFRTRPDQICAIVNSDIFFKSDKNLCECLAKAARGGLVYGQRIEVSDFGSDDGTGHRSASSLQTGPDHSVLRSTHLRQTRFRCDPTAHRSRHRFPILTIVCRRSNPGMIYPWRDW